MTLKEIVESCLESLKRPAPRGAHVIFTTPKGLRRFPKGELLCVLPNGDRTVRYDAMKILAYLKKNGLIEVGNALRVTCLEAPHDRD